MIADLNIYRAANELIEQHGEAADIEAAMRADERLAAGDMEGRAVWLRIVKAIEELLSEERPEDAELHYLMDSLTGVASGDVHSQVHTGQP